MYVLNASKLEENKGGCSEPPLREVWTLGQLHWPHLGTCGKHRTSEPTQLH